MPTRTRIAVLVWLRARDRISTRALATLAFSLERSGALVWHRCDGVVPQRRAESNCRKIRLWVVRFGTRDELNDFGAHDKSSDTAMTMRTTSAIEIRYAVIGFLRQNRNVRHDRGAGADHLGREPYPFGAACGGDEPRRKPARSRAPANGLKEGSDGGALATPRAGALGVAASIGGRRPIRNSKTKSPRRISPCGLCSFCDDGVMPVICPTCQTVFERSKNTEIRRGGFDK